jgi:hypothetical protein
MFRIGLGECAIIVLIILLIVIGIAVGARLTRR